jgi:ribosomal protein S18 acetylase RimI-like enzyme
MLTAYAFFMTKIQSLLHIPPTEQNRAIETAEAIFFETSSRKAFSSESERLKFLYRYFSVYLKNPAFCIFASNAQSETIGYLMGTPETQAEHFTLHPYLELFRKSIEAYPAHLHINLTASCQGQRVGSQLISHFESLLIEQKIRSYHIITSPTDRNVRFYLKNGLNIIQESTFNQTPLVMMGKTNVF